MAPLPLVVFLVGCSASKRANPSPARELYRGQLFRAARRVTEFYGRPWFILSAQHGLVRPEQELAPYDLALPFLSALSRRDWIHQVIGSILNELPQLGFHFRGGRLGWRPNPTFVFLAGRAYVEPLAPGFLSRAWGIETPLAGLGIGRQKQLLNQMLGGAEATGSRAEARRCSTCGGTGHLGDSSHPSEPDTACPDCSGRCG